MNVNFFIYNLFDTDRYRQEEELRGGVQGCFP